VGPIPFLKGVVIMVGTLEDRLEALRGIELVTAVKAKAPVSQESPIDRVKRVNGAADQMDLCIASMKIGTPEFDRAIRTLIGWHDDNLEYKPIVVHVGAILARHNRNELAYYKAVYERCRNRPGQLKAYGEKIRDMLGYVQPAVRATVQAFLTKEQDVL